MNIASMEATPNVTGSHNPSVQEYFGSIESRLGYRLLLGNTRHCGLYKKVQFSPFPISKAQRAMEDKLYTRLDLKPGATVLDAGAGSGHVAMYIAGKGLNVQAIDITPIHVEDAKKNVKANGLEDKVSVQRGALSNGIRPCYCLSLTHSIIRMILAAAHDRPLYNSSPFHQALRLR